MMEYGSIKGCQVCASPDLRSVLFVGYLPPVNRMVRVGTVLDAEPWFPAEMLYCPNCHLVQLGYAVDPKILFPPEYPYTSGTTRILRENFADLYAETCNRVKVSSDDLIVDIGSNDGTLLSNFAKEGHRVLGVEPSLTAKIAQERGISTLMAFFDNEIVRKVRNEYGQASVVTATNVFAHIHNVHQLLHNIDHLLDKEGVFITESHYLPDLIEGLQYDTIYHEHLRYYSLTSLTYLLEMHGFKSFYAKRIPTHGGSIRIYASKCDKYVPDTSIEKMLGEEAVARLTSVAWIDDFRERVVRSKVDLYALLAQLRTEGAQIYGIGAPSRASTLINYIGLDDGLLDCVLEIRGSQKIGKYIPGTTIPVLEESKLYNDEPPYVLLLSWHISSELCRNLKKQGYRGEFIVPLPSPHIIRNADVDLS